MVHINEPHLYITYITRDETGGKKQVIQRKLGPYYTLSISKIDASRNTVTYEAQTDCRQFIAVTLPIQYHSISAVIEPTTRADIV